MKDSKNLAIVALVALAAFLAGGTRRDGDALGQGYPGGTADSNGAVVAVTGTIGSGVSVLYVIDTETRHLAVYQCKGGKSIELVAARNIEWDQKIEQFHDESLYTPEKLRRQYFSEPVEGPSKGGNGSEGSGKGGTPEEGKEGG
jgi:hypothetical protein